MASPPQVLECGAIAPMESAPMICTQAHWLLKTKSKTQLAITADNVECRPNHVLNQTTGWLMLRLKAMHCL